MGLIRRAFKKKGTKSLTIADLQKSEKKRKAKEGRKIKFKLFTERALAFGKKSGVFAVKTGKALAKGVSDVAERQEAFASGTKPKKRKTTKRKTRKSKRK